MELKLLQKDVAKICGVTGDCIVNWETNRTEPQIKFFPNIIKFLGYLPFKINTNTFPGRLTAYRCINGLSQKNLGKIIGVDASTVCSWEVGESKPQKGMLKKLAVMLESGSPSFLAT